MSPSDRCHLQASRGKDASGKSVHLTGDSSESPKHNSTEVLLGKTGKSPFSQGKQGRLLVDPENSSVESYSGKTPENYFKNNNFRPISILRGEGGNWLRIGHGQTSCLIQAPRYEGAAAIALPTIKEYHP